MGGSAAQAAWPRCALLLFLLPCFLASLPLSLSAALKSSGTIEIYDDLAAGFAGPVTCRAMAPWSRVAADADLTGGLYGVTENK